MVFWLCKPLKLRIGLLPKYEVVPFYLFSMDYIYLFLKWFARCGRVMMDVVIHIFSYLRLF